MDLRGDVGHERLLAVECDDERVRLAANPYVRTHRLLSGSELFLQPRGIRHEREGLLLADGKLEPKGLEPRRKLRVVGLAAAESAQELAVDERDAPRLK